MRELGTGSLRGRREGTAAGAPGRFSACAWRPAFVVVARACARRPELGGLAADLAKTLLGSGKGVVGAAPPPQRCLPMSRAFRTLRGGVDGCEVCPPSARGLAAANRCNYFSTTRSLPQYRCPQLLRPGPSPPAARLSLTPSPCPPPQWLPGPRVRPPPPRTPAVPSHTPPSRRPGRRRLLPPRRARQARPQGHLRRRL